MASNISCFVDSLKNHQFVPGREQAEAQRPTASGDPKEYLVVVLGEEPVAMPLSMECGLGLGFRAPPAPFVILVGGCSE